MNIPRHSHTAPRIQVDHNPNALEELIVAISIVNRSKHFLNPSAMTIVYMFCSSPAGKIYRYRARDGKPRLQFKANFLPTLVQASDKKCTCPNEQKTYRVPLLLEMNSSCQTLFSGPHMLVQYEHKPITDCILAPLARSLTRTYVTQSHRIPTRRAE